MWKVTNKDCPSYGHIVELVHYCSPSFILCRIDNGEIDYFDIWELEEFTPSSPAIDEMFL